jgi:hypothetical protein
MVAEKAKRLIEPKWGLSCGSTNNQRARPSKDLLLAFESVRIKISDEANSAFNESIFVSREALLPHEPEGTRLYHSLKLLLLLLLLLIACARCPRTSEAIYKKCMCTGIGYSLCK